MKTQKISILLKWQNIIFNCSINIVVKDLFNDYDFFKNDLKLANINSLIIEQLTIIFPELEEYQTSDEKNKFICTHNIDYIIKDNDINNIMICCKTESDLSLLIQQIHNQNSLKLQKIGFYNVNKKILFLNKKSYIVSLDNYLIDIDQSLHYIKINILANNISEEIYMPKHFLRYIITEATLIKEFVCTEYLIDLAIELFIHILNSNGINIQLLEWSYVRQNLHNQLKINIYNKVINTYFLIPKLSINFINLLEHVIFTKKNEANLLDSNLILPFNVSFDLCSLTIDEIEKLDINHTIVSRHPVSLENYFIDGISCFIDVITKAANQLKICGVHYDENK